jgi:hypothetical protein
MSERRYGSPGQRGLGGTEVSSGGPQELGSQELAMMSDQQERAWLASRGAPEPMQRTMGNGQDPPEWLQQYMSKQPYTDPYHQIAPNRIDIINSNKYLSDKERLKFLRDEQRHSGTR